MRCLKFVSKAVVLMSGMLLTGCFGPADGAFRHEGATICPSAAPMDAQPNIFVWGAEMKGDVGQISGVDGRACDTAGFFANGILDVRAVVEGPSGEPAMAVLRISNAFARDDLVPGNTVTLEQPRDIQLRGCTDFSDDRWSFDERATQATITVVELTENIWEYRYNAHFPAGDGYAEHTLDGSFKVMRPR